MGKLELPKDGLAHKDKHETISSQIAGLIREQITKGNLRPGDRIPSERYLAEQLNVGRSSVREAFHELRTQGFIDSRKGRQGTRVASLTRIASTGALNQLLEAKTDWLLDLIELRYGLEVQAAGLAARRRTEEDMRRLREIVTELDAVHHDRRKAASLDVEFHAAVAQATHNNLYQNISIGQSGLLQDHIPSILSVLWNDPRSMDELPHQHEEIVAAIERQDERGARRAMAQHLDYIMKGVARDQDRSDEGV
ncbi:MAG: FadR/GntR family transcriptional regulator [Thermoleophilia bacterium]